MIDGLYTADEIRNANNLDDAKDMVRHNMVNSDRWLCRGLCAIFARQTSDERDGEYTKYDNKIGFNGADSTILSSFAKQVERWEKTPVASRRFARPLSPKQLGMARTKMHKYAGQLVGIAQAKAAAV